MNTLSYVTKRHIGVLLFVVMGIVSALSNDYIVVKLDSLIRRATAIVESEILQVATSRDVHNAPIKVVTLRVLEKIVGGPVEPVITLHLPILTYESRNRPLTPTFKTGEKSILILKRLPEGTWMVLGHDQGKYEITNGTIEGSGILKDHFKRQIADFVLGRIGATDLPQTRKARQDSVGDSNGDGISKLEGEFHLLDPLRYGPTSGTVEFRINPANAKDANGNSLSFNDIKAAIQRAVDTWNNVTHSNITFSIYGSSTNDTRGYDDGVSTITFEPSGTFYGSNGAAWVFHTNGTIDEVDIGFNQSNRWNTDVNYPSTYNKYDHPVWGQIGPVDLEDVSAHELGHGVGLHHVGSAYEMYTLYGTDYAESNWWEKTWRRSLEKGDKSGKVYQSPSSSPSLSGSLSFSLLYGAPPSVNVSASVTGNLTVPSGYTLAFETGDKGTFSFSGNYKLRVEGKLVVGGGGSAVTSFTRSGGSWYGIEFYNGNGGSSIDHATIENAEYGVYAYATTVPVSYCTIRNNTHGAYVYNNSSTFSHNTVHDNTYGFDCASYGDPNIGPNNILKWNSWAVRNDATSAPNLGSTTGYNSIYSNDYYDVYSSYSGTIYARGNWWGSYPAAPGYYGTLDYSNAFSYDINARMAELPPIGPPAGLFAKLNVSPDTSGLRELDHAYGNYANGHYESALGAFQGLLARYGDSFIGTRALVFADRILEKLGRDAKPNLYAAINRGPGKVASVAGSLLVSRLVKEGSYEDALNGALALITDSEKSIVKDALYNAGNILWYSMGNGEKAREFFGRLISEFPDDPLSASAQSALNGTAPSAPRSPQVQLTTTARNALEIDSYPNPFNPTTRIQFSVPGSSRATLKVFNMLGQEVATLYDAQAEAGKVYDVLIDASRLPSGVYISRLESGGSQVSRKLILAK